MWLLQKLQKHVWLKENECLHYTWWWLPVLHWLPIQFWSSSCESSPVKFFKDCDTHTCRTSSEYIAMLHQWSRIGMGISWEIEVCFSSWDAQTMNLHDSSELSNWFVSWSSWCGVAWKSHFKWLLQVTLHKSKAQAALLCLLATWASLMCISL